MNSINQFHLQKSNTSKIVYFRAEKTENRTIPAIHVPPDSKSEKKLNENYYIGILSEFLWH